MSKYCIMPFASIRIEDLENKNSMGVRPCCLYESDENLQFKSIKEYLESDFLKNLQKHFLTQPDLPPGCRGCSLSENNGHLSIRQSKAKFFDTPYLDRTEIRELDIFPSNTCNFSCFMCSPKFSSAYSVEYKKLGIIDEIFNFDITENISKSIEDLEPINYATIAGGEFFYLKHRRKLLEALLKNNKNIKLKIISNASVFDNKNLDLLGQFTNLVLRFSLDGVGINYECIRYPASWQKIENNIMEYKTELPNARIEIVMATQPLCIFSIFDWIKYAGKNNFETHWNPFYGDKFSWKILDEEEKRTVSNWLLSELPKHDLLPRQKIYIVNLAKNVLKKEGFDKKSREYTIRLMRDLCNLRKFDIIKLSGVLDPWPNLKKEFLEKK